MSTGPAIPKSPLEVLTQGPHHEPPLLAKYVEPFVCASLGFIGVAGANWALKRPFFSGLPRYAMFTVGGAVVGKLIGNYRREYFADRDAVLRHYVELHPDDFPPFNSLKFSEVLEPWIPMR